MHTQYLTIKEDIEFLKVPPAQQMPTKNLKAKHIEKLGSLPQFHLGSNLDKECSIVYYNIVDMHKLTPNIQEVMTFPNWLSVKQNMRKLPSLESVLYNPIWTIEINAFLAP
jgi:hypothetical protein